MAIIKKDKKKQPVDYDEPLKEGIPVRKAIELVNELKTKNMKSAERILNALDLPPHSK